MESVEVSSLFAWDDASFCHLGMRYNLSFDPSKLPWIPFRVLIADWLVEI